LNAIELNHASRRCHLDNVSELEQIGDRLLVLFDGRCGFCNASVRWFVRHDSRDRLRFVASDSPLVAGLLARYGLNADETTGNSGTILVAAAMGSPMEQIYSRSNAVLAILSELPTPWPAVARLISFIPRPLSDVAYRLVARWRYRLVGRLESCPIPTAAERVHFL
jgi:predicted DCC family thiol-disulfide oxidoreductase YuxK